MSKSIGKVAIAAVALSLVASGCAKAMGPQESAGGDGFPNGDPVEIIVPYDAGGFTDVLTRIVAEGMAADLGSPVQVINTPGAGGSIGLSELSVAKPDGLTIGMFNMPSGLSYLDSSRGLSYTRESFAPVAGLAVSPTVVAVRADAPWQTFADLANAAKADPGQITLAGGTNPTSDDALAVTALEQDGVDFNVITVDTGGADKTTQLLGGQIQVTVGSLGAVQVAVDSDQVRLLAVSSPEPNQLIPDVPTLAELGYDIDTSGNITIAAPAGTPEEAIARLSTAAEKALADPDVVKTANAAGYDIQFRDSADLGAYWEEQEAAAKKILEVG